jgi:hypothetical protein
MIVRADPLDRPQRPRPEARAGAVGDAEIHRHPDHRHLQVAEIRILGRDLAIGRGKEGRDAGIGRNAGAALGKDLVGDAAELRVEQIAAMALAVFGAQRVQFRLVEIHLCSSMRDCPPPDAGASRLSCACDPVFYACWARIFGAGEWKIN